MFEDEDPVCAETIAHGHEELAVFPRIPDQYGFRRDAVLSFLQRHGVKTDIWFTEYGKYSNDDPSYKHAAFDHYHANSDERTAAAYNIKYLVILFSHGVSRVFFHQRTWPLGLNDKGNRIHFDMLFDYGPRPHKFFPGVNALAYPDPATVHLAERLGLQTRFVERCCTLAV